MLFWAPIWSNFTANCALELEGLEHNSKGLGEGGHTPPPPPPPWPLYCVLVVVPFVSLSVNLLSIRDKCELQTLKENIVVFYDLNIKSWFYEICSSKVMVYANKSLERNRHY
jgi:hypothetical protein